ncbi:MAG: type III-B CRISPR module RAMP protein Cmr6 [Desulfobacterales bacterium]|nr:type III-B CRISPR module RAMP protein Cmr6 [Desulfobacterales bacterium]
MIPEFLKQYWNNYKNHNDIHAGLALYRFFDASENQKNKSLEIISKINNFDTASKIFLERQKKHLESLKLRGYSVCSFKLTTASRLACGLGISSLAENGFFMDRVWGIPYLPGSSLKGIAQDWALIELDVFTEKQNRRETKRLNKDFIAIFGAQSAEEGEIMDKYWKDRKGTVIFLDAVPILENISPYDIDIVNPHYSDYYSSKGDKPPADYERPNPNFFLTVKKEIKFQFAIAAKDAKFQFQDKEGKEIDVDISAQKLLSNATQYLQNALQEHGIGAKTHIGNGYFKCS